jgi:preprotein translocase subunit SecF
MQIFHDPNFNFIKYRWHATMVSLLIVLVGVGLFLTRGVNVGVDFAGGANIILKFQGNPPLDQLRHDLPDATIQQYGRPQDNGILIRLPQQKREGDYAGAIVQKLHSDLNPEAATKHDLNFLGTDRLASLLIQNDPENRGSNPAATEYYSTTARGIITKRSELGIFTSTQQAAAGVSPAIAKTLSAKAFAGRFNVLNQETVGPQVGKQLQGKAFWAIILSSLAMGIYIWLRFDVVFGIGAVVCIIHDVLIALTFLLLLNLEFSLNIVAALLTIVGYSINDTVVMYDRVRENKKKIKKPMTLAEHLNLAINQTLSRTILTSGTVFLVLIAMLIFGGEVIRGFSWILTIGVISGTYSTLYVVPAMTVAWDRWRGSNSGRRPATAAAAVESPRASAPARNRKVS